MMKRSVSRFLGMALTGCLAAAGLSLLSASDVSAASYPSEVLLGTFWESDNNTTDTVYWSTDGVNFYELSEAYTDATPNDPSTSWIAGTPYNVSTLHDPSIIYKDGYFYMLSGFSQNNRIIPMIGSSKDLVHWSYPNSGSRTNVGVTATPAGSEKYGSTWDMVAPDFMVDDDGTVWIVVSLGYYASWHNDSSQNDIMQPYLIKATGLKPGADPASDPGAQPIVSYSNAVPINLPQYDSSHTVTNRIDGSLYKEGNYYYFSVKKDGVTNEIWRTTNLSLDAVQNETNWELVTDDAVTGFEGPSLTKYNGTYYMYTDKLKDYPPENADGKAGVYVSVASTATTGSLDSFTGWLEKNQFKIVAHSADGGTKECRHGTVITVTDRNAVKTIWDLRARTRYNNTSGTSNTPALASTGWYNKESFKASYYGGFLCNYWYEGNVRQGLTGRGKEIYDPGSDAWYWLDSNADGKMAVSKDVYQPYTIQGQDEIGKWVRYDEYGHMIKGEDHRHIEGTADNAEWGYWYFDQTTGAMLYGLQTVTTTNAGTGATQTKTVYYDDTTGLLLKGYHTIGDTLYFFDPYTGEVINGWYADPDTGVLYWYENSARQGYNVNNPDYRGKEIYDPTTDAWYWLDNVQQGAVAKSKDVYQESYAGRFADRGDGTGKWVRYDQWGKMIKGWDWGALDNNGIHQYFDEDTGAMAKGDVWIGDEHWSFDWNTGYGTRLN